MKIKVKMTCVEGYVYTYVADGSSQRTLNDGEEMVVEVAGNDSLPTNPSRSELREYFRGGVAKDWIPCGAGTAGIPGKVKFEALDVPVVVRQYLPSGPNLMLETDDFRDWLVPMGKSLTLKVQPGLILTGAVRSLSVGTQVA